MNADSLRANTPEPALGRLALLPLCLVVVVALHLGLEWPFGVALGVAMPLLVLFLIAPWVCQRQLSRLDRKLITLQVRGDWAQAKLHLERTAVLRLLAPRALMAEREGRIAAAAGEHPRALKAYLEAEAGYRGQPPLGVLLGLGDSAYALGDHRRALKVFRKVLAWDRGLHRVQIALAHCLLSLGEKTEAKELLDALDEPQDEPQRQHYRLLRAALAKGKEAKKWRKLAGKAEGAIAKAIAELR